MEIKTAVLADAANVSQEGKLNITGIFTRLSGETFPLMHPSMVLVIVFGYHTSEAGDHAFTLNIADEDGKKIAGAGGGFKLQRPPSHQLPPTGQFLLPLAMVTFPEPGVYSFDILIDGRYEGSALIEVADSSG